jgi:hypothetical protein
MMPEPGALSAHSLEVHNMTNLSKLAFQPQRHITIPRPQRAVACLAATRGGIMPENPNLI